MARNEGKIQPHWWSKTFAGIIAGFLLSIGIVGIFAWLGPDGLTQPISEETRLWKTQFNMWVITPIWLTILSFVYLFRTGVQAWCWLGGLATLTIVIVACLRGLL
ncbi:hypothetical protein A7985_04270 [Pseudoalteromonas luteoviolacea]|uniref:Uncharacterized protein n=1 Tax=Pseudoalteromonas luteoviolacea TaxID=43657 RepID=A0A1C0TV20_9GAMM|nr:hypothetical protein [Pseudoalteromonas luteoviolacea]MBQ4809712.1 hypothetical protein [Pseudoalteromonas luteoviolacea]OCQ23170.1 hypothetical protein A7985_04270 [Pseudoalteromonas luteoviolacea]